MPKKLYILLVVFVILDLCYSFSQYYHHPTDGDMSGCIYPADDYKAILSHPLGLPVLKGETSYSNPNRFFSHWPYYHYYRNVPLWLQSVVSPITSLYLSGAIFKILVHIGLLVLLAYCASGGQRPGHPEFILAAAIITPFFHANGFSATISIIDPATTYTFFYAFSLLLFIWYCIPLFFANDTSQKRPTYWWQLLISVPFAIVVALGGGINSGVGLLIAVYAFMYFGIQKLRHTSNLTKLIKSIPKSFWIYLVPLALMSLYAFILSNLNIATEEPRHQLSLLERYARLITGLKKYLFDQPALPLLILALAGNYFMLRRQKHVDMKPTLAIYHWVIGFAVLYILTLPLGGYRSYRPWIIRYDTMLPIYLMLVFLLARGYLTLLPLLSGKLRSSYQYGLGVLLLFFTLTDNPGWSKNACERKALLYISQQTEKEVILPENCTVLAWDNPGHPEASYMSAELLFHWNITDEVRYYYYPKEK